MKPKSAMALAFPSGQVGTWRSLSTRYSMVCPVLMCPVGHFCPRRKKCLVHPGTGCMMHWAHVPSCSIPSPLPSAGDADVLRGCLRLTSPLWLWWPLDPALLVSTICCICLGSHHGCFPPTSCTGPRHCLKLSDMRCSWAQITSCHSLTCRHLPIRPCNEYLSA